MSAPRVLVAGAVLGQPMGGVRRHNQALLPRAQQLLSAQGGALAILEGATPPELELPDAVERLHSIVPAGPPLLRALREGSELRRALEQARAEGRAFDLVHTAHLPTPHRLGVPYSLTLHDLRSLVLPGARRVLAKRVIADAVRRARVVVCVSEAVRQEVESRFQPRASALVPNGVDHLPLLARAEPAEAYLLHVGHLEPRKDLGTLVRALALDSTLPPLLLVGASKGDEDARLQSLARELGVEARLRLAGVVSDAELAAYYAGAACVVIPSRLEGFGIPALEALRAGAPLALSSAAARPLELARDVPTFAARDAQACAEAIRRALAGERASPERVSALVAWASWDSAAEALVRAWTQAAQTA